MELGGLIYSLSVLRNAKSRLEEQLKDVGKEITAAEKDIIEALQASNLRESATGNFRVAISESTYPQVENWDLFGGFILDNRMLHLLERRPAVLAYREMLQLRRAVPGVVPFEKLKLNFRTLNNDD